MSEVIPFASITADDGEQVGGKGLSLGLLTRAGLPVPDGFVLSTAAYRWLRGGSLRDNAILSAEILEAYRALGGGAAAVRSSAADEDGAVASFAGQQETFLGVVGEDALFDAITRCWASLQTERAVAYRKRQGISDTDVAMAVVVQKLVDAEAAGVLFTRDPLDSDGRRMLVEASWGLGESVVSGRVTPDRYHLDHDTGAVLHRHISCKRLRRTATGEEPVSTEKQNAACLDDAQLGQLADLGRKVEALYGGARDIEWAWANGKLWLLQARPITAVTAAEREQLRQQEISRLQERAEPTIWSRFNLSEILPEPTPMTWAIVSHFMSGRGGYGWMYRDLGFDPDPALDAEGPFELICGRPYCNLDRQLRLQFRNPPLEYSFAAFKADPSKAMYPQPVPNPARAGLRFWAMLPVISLRMAFRLARFRRILPQFLRGQLLPSFAADARRTLQADLATAGTRDLLAHLDLWTAKTLTDFARHSLKPTALAGMALEALERKLAAMIGKEKTPLVIRELVMNVQPDPEADLPNALCDLATGRLEQAAFLERFGHRGNQEMELSKPRWREEPDAIARLIAATAALPVIRDEERQFGWEPNAAGILKTPQIGAIRKDLEILRGWLSLRETCKHYLMLGYAVIRRLLLEVDRRYSLNGGIFYLLPDELPRLLAGDDFTTLIAERRRRRSIALGLEVPPVLFSDDLEAIGRPVTIEGAETVQGTPLSAGVAEGRALVLDNPEGVRPPPGSYILVCPSTDPAWVPLFVHAAGLVMETGGVLSHGAIVAREFHLPAVAGLPDIHRRIRDGQKLRVDGNTGTVSVLLD